MKAQKSVAFKFSLAMIVALLSLPVLVFAQGPPMPLTVKPLHGGVYWSSGGDGGNTGFIVGKGGVIVIDAKTTPASARDFLAQIAKVTSEPVTTVILTHSDADHVNGLAAFPKGMTIIAQEGCKKEIEESLTGPEPSPRDYFPNHTVKNKEVTTIDGVRLELLHWVPAHTSGDLITYLPAQKIVFTGDIVAAMPGQMYTGIHPAKHGSSAGWIETMKGILALDADTFVPGHGDLQTRADLEARLARVEQRRAQIFQLAAQGKSLDQVKQALNDTSKDTVLPNGLVFPTFTEVVYMEATKKN